MSDPNVPGADVIPLPQLTPVVAPFNLRSAQQTQSLIDPATFLQNHPEQIKKPDYHFPEPKAANNVANRAEVHQI
jgi:hypothetical protein